MKLLMSAFVMSVLVSSAILAGSALAEPLSSPPSETGRSSALLRQNNITSTGATVPHPGASQGSGPTPLDRDLERMNDRIQNICKGC